MPPRGVRWLKLNFYYMKGTIYIIKNNCNKKVYIGKTFNNLHTRYREHIRDSRKKRCENRILYSAIKKYGEENFYIEELEKDIDENLLSEKEINYIKEYNSYKYGYNTTLGGDGARYIPYTDEEVISLYKKKKVIRHTAKELKISEDTVSLILHNNNIEIFKPNNKKIKIIELELIFNSIADCGKFLFNSGRTKATTKNSIVNNIKRSIKRNGTYLGLTYKIYE